MAKKGPIGKVEGFYITHHYHLKTLQELAKDLGRTKKSIENYINKNNIKTNRTVEAKTDGSEGGHTAGEQFIRQEGVTIMTENASTISDERRTPRLNNNDTNRVTRIR
jgi:predicted transcriptional regulator